MPQPLHFPGHKGFAALDELSSVPWHALHQAYGLGVTGDGIHDDVAGSLRMLVDDPDEALLGGLYSNICHQGTVYEATAYAVPFIAAIADGDIAEAMRFELVHLLGNIALAASFTTEDGSSSGAYGHGVSELIRDSLTRSSVFLRSIECTKPELAVLVGAIVAIAGNPNRANSEALRAALGDYEA
jgi:hypothetical protein